MRERLVPCVGASTLFAFFALDWLVRLSTLATVDEARSEVCIVVGELLAQIGLLALRELAEEVLGQGIAVPVAYLEDLVNFVFVCDIFRIVERNNLGMDELAFVLERLAIGRSFLLERLAIGRSFLLERLAVAIGRTFTLEMCGKAVYHRQHRVFWRLSLAGHVPGLFGGLQIQLCLPRPESRFRFTGEEATNLHTAGAMGQAGTNSHNFVRFRIDGLKVALRYPLSMKMFYVATRKGREESAL